MAYNNYFPVGYQPFVYQYPNNTPYQPQGTQSEAVQPAQQTMNQNNFNASQNAIIWVQGEAGAKAYPVAPNTTVQLWDSEEQVIYLKSADASGMPSLKTLDYTIRETKPHISVAEKPQIDMSGFITRDEFEQRMAEVCKQTIKTKKVNADE